MSELESPHQLPRHTTPTWEVELLISGVAVFAMLQLPGWLDDQAFALLPRFGTNWAEPGKFLYIYAKSATIMLAVTFALHLVLRAHWIALVGMFSVYPDGVRWENLKLGPIKRLVEQDLSSSPDDTIDRADNRATTVFALGVMLASILIVFSIGLFLTYSLAITLLLRFGVEFDTASVFFGCLAVAIAPLFLANLADRHLGKRFAPGGISYRVLHGVLRLYARFGIGHWSVPLRLMASHASERKMALLTMLIIGSVTSGTVIGYKNLQRPEMMGDYGLFPDMGEATVSSAYYNDQRDPTRDDVVPFVQTMVVVGPYLKLVVPYDPLRDVAALRAHCPTTGVDDASASASHLACLAGLHALTLDGKLIPEPGYLASSDPRTDRPALLAMIDVRGLSPGRHTLRITHPLRSDKPDDQDDPGFDSIPFWR